MLVSARRFEPGDAEFCFRCRSSAFIVEFRDELDPAAVADCVNAYMPADYRRMSSDLEFFVVEENGDARGFFTLQRVDRTTAELQLIYLDRAHLGKGLGTWCFQYLEKWIASDWPEVTSLFLDTIIPGYNGGFYRKMGFSEVAEVSCSFLGRAVPAARFAKQLGEEGT